MNAVTENCVRSCPPLVLSVQYVRILYSERESSRVSSVHSLRISLSSTREYIGHQPRYAKMMPCVPFIKYFEPLVQLSLNSYDEIRRFEIDLLMPKCAHLVRAK